ncbi:arrestin-N domain-containing protein [Favolaschia claudopus]|uniref:Arrestin-N domain-containing protein n=1 Tax=Favolaschia claudopus TaxID=2862362 RepID=A0AAW0DZQ0_9AGAR
MSPQNNIDSSAFVLHFPDAVRIAGESVQGRVELNVALAQDEGIENLDVYLRGYIVTTIIENNFDGSDTRHEREIELINFSKLLWARGTAFPDPGSHLLDLPFKFQLPVSLPPSFHLSVINHEATIQYIVEVVGSRPGRFRRDNVVHQIFPVLPAASPEQVVARKSLKKGWHGAWTAVSVERKIRQGIWGDHAHARAKVKIPELESFPRATPVPISLYIETRTKPMALTAIPADKYNKPLFPAPPTHSAEVKLFFEREASIRTWRKSAVVADTFPTRSVFGDLNTSVDADVEAAQWIPDPERKDYGVWKRSARFDTTVTLPFAPTFSTETIDSKYFLHFQLSFPGMGNDLELHVPISLHPAHTCPSFALNYADVPPEGTPPLRLIDELPPPAYSIEHLIAQAGL